MSDEIEIASPIGMSKAEIEGIQASMSSQASSDDELSNLQDDINIHISSLEAKLITKGDSMDDAIVESIRNTIQKAKTTVESGDQSDLEATLSRLEEHSSLFPA